MDDKNILDKKKKVQENIHNDDELQWIDVESDATYSDYDDSEWTDAEPDTIYSDYEDLKWEDVDNEKTDYTFQECIEILENNGNLPKKYYESSDLLKYIIESEKYNLITRFKFTSEAWNKENTNKVMELLINSKFNLENLTSRNRKLRHNVTDLTSDLFFCGHVAVKSTNRKTKEFLLMYINKNSNNPTIQSQFLEKYYKLNEKMPMPPFLKNNILSNIPYKILDLILLNEDMIPLIIKFSQKDDQRLNFITFFIKNYNKKIYFLNVFRQILHNMDNESYDELFKNEEIFKNNCFKKMLFLLTRDYDLKIKNINDLKKIYKINSEHAHKLEASNDSNDVKESLLIKLYGISLNQAKKIIEEYQTLLISDNKYIFKNNEEYLNILLTIKKIVNCPPKLLRSFKNLYTINSSPVLFEGIKAKINNLIIHKFNNSLFNTEENKNNVIPNSENLPLYYAAGKDGNQNFGIMFTSIGAFASDMKFKKNGDLIDNPDNFQKYTRDIEDGNINICCSYISNNCLCTAPINHYAIGFDTLENNSLMNEYVQDSHSSMHKGNFSAKVTKFMLPENLEKYTIGYNEINITRTKLNTGDRRMPSYIVYICEDFENETPDSLQNTIDAYNDFKKNGYDLPIVIVERKKIFKNCLNNMINLLKQYQENLDSYTLKSLLEQYNSIQNITGYIDDLYQENLHNFFLSKINTPNPLDIVFSTIANSEHPTYYLNELEKTVKRCSKIESLLFEEDILNKINELKNKLMDGEKRNGR